MNFWHNSTRLKTCVQTLQNASNTQTNDNWYKFLTVRLSMHFHFFFYWFDLFLIIQSSDGRSIRHLPKFQAGYWITTKFVIPPVEVFIPTLKRTTNNNNFVSKWFYRCLCGLVKPAQRKIANRMKWNNNIEFTSTPSLFASGTSQVAFWRFHTHKWEKNINRLLL